MRDLASNSCVASESPALHSSHIEAWSEDLEDDGSLSHFWSSKTSDQVVTGEVYMTTIPG